MTFLLNSEKPSLVSANTFVTTFPTAGVRSSVTIVQLQDQLFFPGQICQLFGLSHLSPPMQGNSLLSRSFISYSLYPSVNLTKFKRKPYFNVRLATCFLSRRVSLFNSSKLYLHVPKLTSRGRYAPEVFSLSQSFSTGFFSPIISKKRLPSAIPDPS